MGVGRPEPPLARVEGIVSEWVAEELVIYDRNTRAAHALSAAAALVWELCDGRRSPEEIARELHLDRVIVAQAVAQLNQCGLLAQDPQDGVSRRIALRRIAKAGGAALIGAPLISTVLIPPATAAASTHTCAETGYGCQLTWEDNTDCSGPRSSDSCTLYYGSLCTCATSGPCYPNNSTSFMDGTCT